MGKKRNVFSCVGRFLTARLFLAIIVTVMFAAFSPMAEAVIVSTQYVNLNTGPADFGGSSHSFGGPSGNAVITFDYDTSSGQVVATGRVQGTLYWDDLFRGGCTRLTLRFRNEANVNLAVRTVDVCGPGGNANNPTNKVQVDESFASPNLTKVRITTNEVSGGQLVGGASTTKSAPLLANFFTGIPSLGAASLGEFSDPLFSSAFAVIELTRDNGLATGVVTGPLFSGESGKGELDCARAIIDFRSSTGAILDSRSRDTCTSRQIGETFDSGSLFSIRVRVGDLFGGLIFVNSTTATFSFAGQTGNFEVEPSDAAVAVHEPLVYAFTWTVPEPLNWHDLDSLQLRIRDETGIILWLHFDEAANTVSLFNQATGRFGKEFALGSPNRLQTPYATLSLANASATAVNSILGSGPTSPSVTLKLPLSFKPRAAGHTFVVEVAASDDFGSEDPFAEAGTLTVAK